MKQEIKKNFEKIFRQCLSNAIPKHHARFGIIVKLFFWYEDTILPILVKYGDFSKSRNGQNLEISNFLDKFATSSA